MSRSGDFNQTLFTGFLLAVGLLVALATCHQPAYACDTSFVQEPTYREPDEIFIDTVAGFLFMAYDFFDGRRLVVWRIIRTLEIDEGGITAEAYPLFYVLTDRNKRTTTFIDVERHGDCIDIHPY